MKGQTEISAVLWTVLMVIVILSLFGIFFAIKAWLATESEDAICASEIRTHSTLAGLTNDQVTPQINCPTRIITTPVADQSAANALVLQEMKRCWQQWGRGQIDLFDRKEGTYCHVCSMVTIDGVDEIRIVDQMNTPATKDQTYAQYLTNGEGISPEAYKEIQNWRMETKEPIGVIFSYHKGLTGMQRLQEMAMNVALGEDLGTATIRGTAAGAGAGAGALLGVGVAVGVGAAPAVIIPGAIASATIFVGSAALGGGTGMLASIQARPEMNTTALIVVRPLNQQQIAALGCDYAPVAND